jgi:hypothetical protein
MQMPSRSIHHVAGSAVLVFVLAAVRHLPRLHLARPFPFLLAGLVVRVVAETVVRLPLLPLRLCRRRERVPGAWFR